MLAITPSSEAKEISEPALKPPKEYPLPVLRISQGRRQVSRRGARSRPTALSLRRSYCRGGLPALPQDTPSLSCLYLQVFSRSRQGIPRGVSHLTSMEHLPPFLRLSPNIQAHL